MLTTVMKKVLYAACIGLGAWVAPVLQAATLDEQRAWYEQAQDALEDNDAEKFSQLRNKLDKYPLTPYLDYRDFSRSLTNKSPQEVQAFLTQHKTLPFHPTIQYRYASYLAIAQRWDDFLAFQPTKPRGEVLQCQYYYAKLQQGKKQQAWQGAEQIWLKGSSIADECDPLLEAWDKAGKRHDENILNRMILVYKNGNKKFLTYLNKQLSTSGRITGNKVIELLDKPALVADFAKASKVTPFNQQLTAAAYQRLARKDVKEAVKHYTRTMDGQHYSKAKRQQLAEFVASRLMTTDNADLITWRDKVIAKSTKVSLIERRIRNAMREADWPAVEVWVQRLPAKAKETTRWTFWQAYLLARDGKQAQANKMYESLLGLRDFYSVAAATILKKPIEYPISKSKLVVKDTDGDRETLNRIKELVAVDKLYAARSEWAYLLRGKKPDQALKLATYAAANRWHHLAVQATIAGRLWSYHELRFPLAHKWWFDFFSKERDLPTTTMMALARQESAWNTEAQSPVGARGLMQLMPATAKETAKKLERNYKGKDSLFDPGVNIRLGSGYLKMMLDRHDNNRVYSFAAYNAGPSRVNRWQKQTDGQLDVFTFIEAIPFNETRGYVQNVLMFDVYYSKRMGQKKPLLTPEELQASY
ncbi:murein transglycosylase [Photobacterium sanguinicancri]|uniref:Murein transglycosylase n=2 Tax=Photobacterium sanguinicancri TaxID=875932 RepID=A0AAW7Y5H1_9GAMM|nr:murein transglycosylase [Photobacterium sanguinicancri]MDO6543260.1 murein transglycosylase [Photobacterium sanguinicancri]